MGLKGFEWRKKSLETEKLKEVEVGDYQLNLRRNYIQFQTEPKERIHNIDRVEDKKSNHQKIQIGVREAFIFRRRTKEGREIKSLFLISRLVLFSFAFAISITFLIWKQKF